MSRSFSVANKLFFSANDGTTGNELWVSDGTDPGTYLVMDINPGINGSYYSGNGIVYANKFYFNADNGVNGTELWASDGTAPGTSMIKDINAWFQWRVSIFISQWLRWVFIFYRK
jgi:ELWxxDGT repeat protein